MIDNFYIFKDWFDGLTNQDDFYWVQIIQRKKDGVILPSYTSGARTLKNLYFFNKERFLMEESYIKELCNNNNARAYFWVNPRNSLLVAVRTLSQLSILLEGGNTRNGLKITNKAMGHAKCGRYDDLWIVDIDSRDFNYIDKVHTLISKCADKSAFKWEIPTKNGRHLITNKFNRHKFEQLLEIEKMEPIDIHLDSPTLLYCND